MSGPATANAVDAVLDGQLYMSNLAAAQTVDKHPELGITHVLSVCPDLPSRGPAHLIIPVQDSEYENILDHLADACQFIDNALASGGRVLVHCLMGVSRSATVVASYLMKKRHMSPSQALCELRKRRPCVFPNYGFMKQLQVFEACSYQPSRTNPVYRSWKRKQKQDVTHFLNLLSDTPAIVPKLYINSEFPDDADQATCLVRYIGLTHCLSLSPSNIRQHTLPIDHGHVDIPLDSRTSLVLALPSACDYIRHALSRKDCRILLHSSTESVAVLAVCAYLMRDRNMLHEQALKTVTNAPQALPLFEPTANFIRHLELFSACNYAPTRDHPALYARETPSVTTSSSQVASAVCTAIVSSTLSTGAPASLPVPLAKHIPSLRVTASKAPVELVGKS